MRHLLFNVQNFHKWIFSDFVQDYEKYDRISQNIYQVNQENNQRKSSQKLNNVYLENYNHNINKENIQSYSHGFLKILYTKIDINFKNIKFYLLITPLNNGKFK